MGMVSMVVVIVIVAGMVVAGMVVAGMVVIGMLRVHGFRAVVVVAVYGPDPLGGTQQQLVGHGAGRSEDAAHPERLAVGMLQVGIVVEAVDTAEGVAHLQAETLGRGGSGHHIEGAFEDGALLQPQLVQREEGRVGAHDAVTLVAVAHRQRHRLRDQRVTLSEEGSGRLEGYVAGGHVDVVHAGQDQLQGTALRADHHVDAGEIAVEPVGEHAVEQQDGGDEAGAQRQQGEVQHQGGGAVHQVFPGKPEIMHGAQGSGFGRNGLSAAGRG